MTGRKPKQPVAAPAVDPATIAAVVAALAALGIVGQPAQAAPVAAVVDKEDEEDPALGRKEAAEEARRHDAKMKQAEDLIEQALPLLIRPRHMPILNWLAEGAQTTKAVIVAQILMNGISKQQTAYREAHGQVAASSNRNLLEAAQNS